MMQRTDIPDDMPIQAGLVSKAIQSAQRQVETMNFAARKYVLEYDDVMNKQRSVIYGERNAILDGKDIHDRVEEMMADAISSGVLEFAPEKVYSEEWDWDGLSLWYRELTGIEGAVEELHGEVDNPHEAADALTGRAMEAYARKEEDLGAEGLRELERQVMLRVIDTRWMDHLQEMDYLKDGIGLRAMGQRDPLVEYKTEAFDMFGGLVRAINEDFLRTLLHIEVVFEPEPVMQPSFSAANYSAPSESSIFAGAAAAADAVRCRRSVARPDRGGFGCCGRQRQGGDGRQGQGGPVVRRGPQRSVPLRQRQEVQAVPRRERVGSR